MRNLEPFLSFLPVPVQAAMEKANLADDCDACDDCMDAAMRLSPEDRGALPLPGEVEFIMGGPPCQGYSGMNRFNKSNWSLVQNSMERGVVTRYSISLKQTLVMDLAPHSTTQTSALR